MPYCDPIKQRQAKHESYLRNKTKVIQASTLRGKMIREKINKIKSDLGCCICNEKCAFCLDFHHKDPNLKINTVSRLIREKGWQTISSEIEKCIVLCANCHRKVHAGIIPVMAQTGLEPARN